MVRLSSHLDDVDLATHSRLREGGCYLPDPALEEDDRQFILGSNLAIGIAESLDAVTEAVQAKGTEIEIVLNPLAESGHRARMVQ